MSIKRQRRKVTKHTRKTKSDPFLQFIEEANKGDIKSIISLNTFSHFLTMAAQSIGQECPAADDPAAVANALLLCDLWPLLNRSGMDDPGHISHLRKSLGLGRTVGYISKNNVDRRPTYARRTILEALNAIVRDKSELAVKLMAANKSKDRKRYLERLLATRVKAILHPGKPIREAGCNKKRITEYFNAVIRLPALTSETRHLWFSCIKQNLLLCHRGLPESHPEMRKLGVYRQNKGGARTGTMTAEANIREGIFLRLKATLQHMSQEAAKDEQPVSRYRSTKYPETVSLHEPSSPICFPLSYAEGLSPPSYRAFPFPPIASQEFIFPPASPSSSLPLPSHSTI